MFPWEGIHAAFSWRKSATLASAQAGTANSTDWPLTIDLDGNVQAADTDLKTVGNGGFVQNVNGYDIRPYADVGLTSPLTFELVYYDASTGKLEMHVKIPTLSNTVDTVIYLAFGDASLNSDGSSNSTWNSGYSGVWHLQAQSGTNLIDSTSNGLNGTKKGTGEPAAANDGNLLMGQQVWDGTDDYVTIADASGLSPAAGDFSYSCWVQAVSGSEGWIYSDYDLLGNGLILLRKTSGDKFEAYLRDSGGLQAIDVVGGTTFTGGNPYFLTMVKAGTAVTLYVNGASDGSASNGSLGSVVTNDGTPPAFGLYSFAVTPPLNPYSSRIDEFRFVKGTALSTSWITSDYNSQKASSNFITWGAKQSLTATANRPFWFARR